MKFERPRCRSAQPSESDLYRISVSAFLRVGASLKERSELGAHDDVARLPLHSVEPGADVRIAGKVESTFPSDMRVGIECNVGDGVVTGGKERSRHQVSFHDVERGVAFFVLLVENAKVRRFWKMQQEPRDGDVWFLALLFDKHTTDEV